jgi:hypothetical protein
MKAVTSRIRPQVYDACCFAFQKASFLELDAVALYLGDSLFVQIHNPRLMIIVRVYDKELSHRFTSNADRRASPAIFKKSRPCEVRL